MAKAEINDQKPIKRGGCKRLQTANGANPATRANLNFGADASAMLRCLPPHGHDMGKDPSNFEVGMP